MAQKKLQRTVESGFTAMDAGEVRFERMFNQKGTFMRVDAVTTFTLKDTDGVEFDRYEVRKADVPFDFSWFNAAFRAAAWTAFLVDRGLAEV